jgi:carbon storage regulator
MLVIRRRAGESIVIAGGVEIEVLETSPTRVKLGIRAPKEVSVVRKEVGLTADENRAASRAIRSTCWRRCWRSSILLSARQNQPALVREFDYGAFSGNRTTLLT